MALSNDQVKHLFANHRKGNSNNLHSDGTVLKSYSTPIAVWIDNVCFVSSNGMSPTTSSKHLSGLFYALRGSESFYTPAFEYHAGQAPTASQCIIAAAEEMQETFKTICRKRTYVAESIEQYETRREQIQSLAARFQVQDLPAMPEATGDLKEKAKELAAADKVRKAERTKEEARKKAEKQLADSEQFNEWLQGVPVMFPGSYRQYGSDYLKISINRETVVTSPGAEAPLDHVVKALKFYDSRRSEETFKPYHTNGHKIALGHFTLDSIDEAGNVKAGCHTFTAQEIARFRKQWGL